MDTDQYLAPIKAVSAAAVASGAVPWEAPLFAHRARVCAPRAELAGILDPALGLAPERVSACPALRRASGCAWLDDANHPDGYSSVPTRAVAALVPRRELRMSQRCRYRLRMPSFETGISFVSPVTKSGWSGA